mmetsp:Transcript_123365/g.227246  ORF Transcript_123365/g.227246 Transcript_123365/m.227246 type:complete len:206 (-) Transcript_123365:454-1071(-)
MSRLADGPSKWTIKKSTKLSYLGICKWWQIPPALPSGAVNQVLRRLQRQRMPHAIEKAWQTLTMLVKAARQAKEVLLAKRSLSRSPAKQPSRKMRMRRRRRRRKSQHLLHRSPEPSPRLLRALPNLQPLQNLLQRRRRRRKSQHLLRQSLQPSPRLPRRLPNLQQLPNLRQRAVRLPRQSHRRRPQRQRRKQSHRASKKSSTRTP